MLCQVASVVSPGLQSSTEDSRVAQTRGRQGGASCWWEVPLPVCLCTELHEYLLAWQMAYLEEVVQENKAGAPTSVTT